MQRQVHLLASPSSSPVEGRGLLVHCSGGVGRTGVFLAAFSTIVSALPLNTGKWATSVRCASPGRGCRFVFPQ